MTAIEVSKLEDYFHDVFNGFQADPPDSDFQHGYRDAMIELAKETCSPEFLRMWGIQCPPTE